MSVSLRLFLSHSSLRLFLRGAVAFFPRPLFKRGLHAHVLHPQSIATASGCRPIILPTQLVRPAHGSLIEISCVCAREACEPNERALCRHPAAREYTLLFPLFSPSLDSRSRRVLPPFILQELFRTRVLSTLVHSWAGRCISTLVGVPTMFHHRPSIVPRRTCSPSATPRRPCAALLPRDDPPWDRDRARVYPCERA